VSAEVVARDHADKIVKHLYEFVWRTLVFQSPPEDCGALRDAIAQALLDVSAHARGYR
jgi:hypothetical protein